MASKLGLSAETIESCRRLARNVAEGVRSRTARYTTVATERAVLRLLGVDGVDGHEVPIPNRVVAALQEANRLDRGAAVWMGNALAPGAPEPLPRLQTKLGKLATDLGLAAIKTLGYPSKTAFLEEKLSLLQSYP